MTYSPRALGIKVPCSVVLLCANAAAYEDLDAVVLQGVIILVRTGFISLDGHVQAALGRPRGMCWKIFNSFAADFDQKLIYLVMPEPGTAGEYLLS